MLLDASRVVTAFQRAAVETAAMDIGCGRTSGSGVDELLGDDSISHSFLENALETIIAVCDLQIQACKEVKKSAMTFAMTVTPPDWSY